MRGRFFAWRPAAIMAMAALLAGGTGISLAGNRHSHSPRPWLGVTLGENIDGVSILSVMDDSPAQAAGLEAGDVVVAVDGRPVAGTDEFMAAFRDYEPGDSPSLKVRRDGRELTLQPVLAERKDEFFFQMPRFNFDFHGDPQSENQRRGYLGVQLQSLTDELREYFGAPDGEGILIAKVEEGSPAEKAGLQAGDVITSIDGNKVSSHGDLVKRLESLQEGDPVEIIAYRDRQAQTFHVNVGVKDYQSLGWAIRCENGEDCKDMKFFPHGDAGSVLRMLEDPGWQKEMEERLQELEEHLQRLQSEADTGGDQT